ncbi:hypothetical protein CDD81_6719 [Ophiocordyceps australis]|uniref:SWIM-type domain-containing protein n=1 Tax=Ophiocordyceps australis TaxID=1399860 RepID=A0A2C5Y783_9HYPO|nr:hypothetical protein CDD81_6719 [Ophiocordyceps australis]
MPQNGLPSHRQLILSLIDSLSTTSPGPSAPTPHPADHDRRSLLLTLHVLLPGMVLPALDLLDRQLVSCVSVDNQDFFLVQSSAGSRRGPPRHHLVLLDGWNCSCAAFALDSYGRHSAALDLEPGANDSTSNALPSLEEHTPCCKHLLACLVAQSWRNSLGNSLQQKQVTREELAALISNI